MFAGRVHCLLRALLLCLHVLPRRLPCPHAHRVEAATAQRGTCSQLYVPTASGVICLFTDTDLLLTTKQVPKDLGSPLPCSILSA